MKARSSFADAQEHIVKSRRQAKQWIIDFKGLPNELLLKLSKTTESCEEFYRDHRTDFQNISEKSPDCQLLLAVKPPLKELKSIRKTLEGLADECDNFTQDVSCIL